MIPELRSDRKTKGRQRKDLTLFEEMVLTLIKIRRDYNNSHLAYLFGIDEGKVSRIFTAYAKYLGRVSQQLIVWPDKDLVQQNLPKSFKKFPKTRIVIDATEFKMEKPYRPQAQKISWSNYKHTNTLKLLVGIMPSGAFTFKSKLYGGSISDLCITEQSGLLEK